MSLVQIDGAVLDDVENVLMQTGRLDLLRQVVEGRKDIVNCASWVREDAEKAFHECFVEGVVEAGQKQYVIERLLDGFEDDYAFSLMNDSLKTFVENEARALRVAEASIADRLG